MEVFENSDFSNVDLQNIKNFNYLCELCDDECFDRSKKIKNPECTVKKNKTKSATFISDSKLINASNNFYLTHYNEVYKSNYKARPATAYKPPPDQYDYVPKGFIDLKTIQKVDFVKFEPQEKIKPFKLVDNVGKSNEPISYATSYRAEFVAKENKGLSNIVKRNSNESSMKRPFYSGIPQITTNKDNYKKWTARPISSYSEYPSYAGESIFPNRERSFVTSTASLHPKIDVTKLDKIKKSDIKHNLKNEGLMEMTTSYRDNFIKYENKEAAKKLITKGKSQDFLLSNQIKQINETTQTKADFVFHINHVAPKLSDCNPYNSDLDKHIYLNNIRDLSTMYSNDFIPKNYSRSNSCKHEFQPFRKPNQKVERETVTHLPSFFITIMNGEEYGESEIRIMPASKSSSVTIRISLFSVSDHLYGWVLSLRWTIVNGQTTFRFGGQILSTYFSNCPSVFLIVQVNINLSMKIKT
ncbi:unnamed protein product [Brachionus calyciflorus]|uniref:Uncharacterized protein n=1 Tax=Brachionus calyciflorus TaxID=104777 RepID=A0A813TAV9_9BILA|nr:unnamed protein product [Brachionus calyciflorus]